MPIPSGYTSGQVVQAVPTALATAIFNETQASGTNGGTFTSGSYVKRTLNTTVVNNILGCSIASSVITLPAGTYQVFASAPAYKVGIHKIKLRNTTASTDIAIGGSSFTDASDASVATSSLIQTSFVLSASTNIELQHRAGTTKADNGFGQPSSFSDSEIYSQITITKVA
jgi:hypothetical protein